MGWKEQSQNLSRRINIHSFFLEPDTGLGAGILGGQTPRLGRGGTAKQLKPGKVSAVTSSQRTMRVQGSSGTHLRLGEARRWSGKPSLMKWGSSWELNAASEIN